MKSYIVGGAIRDELLGFSPKDYDYVVVGATPDTMYEKGYRSVGKDFPIFLHPYTHEEYALARTERKIAPGYQGFVFFTDPSITLEQDLARRDLTINAMAKDKNGILIDPFGGQRDLRARKLRHVSYAFTEDPVRILRLSRFAARFPNFSVATETNILMQNMVRLGEIDYLVAERIWQELARGLMERKPSRMFSVLQNCGALSRILPEYNMFWSMCELQENCYLTIRINISYAMLMLDYAANQSLSLEIRFAVLMFVLNQGTAFFTQKFKNYNNEKFSEILIINVCKRLRIPKYCRDLAIMTQREYKNVNDAFKLNSVAIINLFLRCDSFRKPQRFDQMLRAIKCSLYNFANLKKTFFPQADYLMLNLREALTINTAVIAAQYKTQLSYIPTAIMLARIKVITNFISVKKEIYFSNVVNK